MTKTDQLQRVIAAINENSVALPDAACVQVTVGDLRSLIAHSEELLKIAAQVGEAKDPFAAWETIAHLMVEKAPGHTDLMLSPEDIDRALESLHPDVIETTSPPWEWWASADGEHYSVGPCDTREQALEEAVDEELGHFRDEAGREKLRLQLIEAQKPSIDLSSLFEAEGFIEKAYDFLVENFSNEEGEGVEIEASEADELDLEARVRPVIAAWQAERRISVDVYQFGKTRNGEWLVYDLGDAEVAASVRDAPPLTTHQQAD